MHSWSLRISCPRPWSPCSIFPSAGSPAVLGQHHTGSLLLEAGQEGAPLQPQPGQPCVVQNHCHHLSGALQQGTGVLQSRKDRVLCLRLWDGDDWPSDLREANQPRPRNLHGCWAREWVASPGPLTHPKGWRFLKKHYATLLQALGPGNLCFLPEWHQRLTWGFSGHLLDSTASTASLRNRRASWHPESKCCRRCKVSTRAPHGLTSHPLGAAPKSKPRPRVEVRPDFLFKEKALPLYLNRKACLSRGAAQGQKSSPAQSDPPLLA